MAQGAKTKKKEKTDVKEAAVESRTAPRLRERFREVIAPAMMKQFRYKNIWQVPKPSKVVINMGLGEADRKSTRLNSSHLKLSRMPSSA